MKSGSMASFRAAAEIGDPPDEIDIFCHGCTKDCWDEKLRKQVWCDDLKKFLESLERANT